MNAATLKAFPHLCAAGLIQTASVPRTFAHVAKNSSRKRRKELIERRIKRLVAYRRSVLVAVIEVPRADTTREDALAAEYMALPSHPPGALRAFCKEHSLTRSEMFGALQRLRDRKRGKL